MERQADRDDYLTVFALLHDQGTATVSELALLGMRRSSLSRRVILPNDGMASIIFANMIKRVESHNIALIRPNRCHTPGFK